MTNWLIKGLRTITTIVGLGTVSGGIFHLASGNNIEEQKSAPLAEEDDTAFELEEQTSKGAKTPVSRPILEECKKKWESSTWNRDSDKLCGRIYITKEEENNFWMTL